MFLFLSFVVVPGANIGYEWFFLARSGQTIGKKLMTIRVVPLADVGRLTGRQARRRGIAYGPDHDGAVRRLGQRAGRLPLSLVRG
ncbi:MAG: RDD family protein [Pseudonocardiaceae bacterium]